MYNCFQKSCLCNIFFFLAIIGLTWRGTCILTTHWQRTDNAHVCVFVLVGASFSLVFYQLFFIRKTHHCRQPHRISKHLLALSNFITPEWTCFSDKIQQWSQGWLMLQLNILTRKEKRWQGKRRRAKVPMPPAPQPQKDRPVPQMLHVKHFPSLGKCLSVQIRTLSWCGCVVSYGIASVFMFVFSRHAISPWQNMKCHLSHVQCGQNMEYHLVRSTLSKT